MTWQPQSKFWERQLEGANALPLNASVNLKIGIVTETVIDQDVIQKYSSLTPVATNVGWTGPVVLTGVTAALIAGDFVLDAADMAAIAQDAGGFANGGTYVLFYDDIDDYILATFTPGGAFGNVGGPLDLDIAAAGLVKTTI